MSETPTFPPPPAPPTYVPGSTEHTQPLPVDRPPAPRGRAGFVAGVITAAVLAGGAAGVGGAAAWNAFDDEPSGTSDSDRTTSQVAQAPGEPAPDGSVESVAQNVLPSVVKLDVTSPSGQSGSGSGIILSPDGEILTNEHVAAIAGDGGQITVSFTDGSKAAAEILGTDPLTDTALVKAEGVSGLTPVTVGESGALAVGEQVVAIGSPFGLDATVTSGIVSALDRPVAVGSDAEGNSTTYPAIQTDAAINPGNSGGPLVDMAGSLVGINSSIRSSGAEAGSIGLGFAIPIDEVGPIVEQMRAGETPTHARLGITVSDVADATDASVTEGALVQEIGGDSTAADAGLEGDDVITRIDDTQITGADSLVATIRSYRPGDEVEVVYERGGNADTTTLTLDSDAD
ncbi:MAG: trypsin-like peptidase domain-containing protein [Nocardioides sp.]